MMMMMKKRSRRSVGTCNIYLPMELIEEEILWRLPVKTIIRCGSVCKSWYSLIRTPNFITTHLHKTIIGKPPLVFLRNLVDDCFYDRAQLSFILENPNHPFNVDHLDCRVLHLPHPNPNPNPTTKPSFRHELLGGSCNGLLCLVYEQDMSTFILCNPSISFYIKLPMPQLVPLSNSPQQLLCHLLGFGFDEDDEDYKIVRIVPSNTSTTTNWAAELFSLNSNYWWPIPPIHGVPGFDFVDYNVVGAFVKGRLHWIVSHDNHTNTGHFILVFDLNHETFHHISFPKCLEGSDAEVLTLLAFGDSSIVLVRSDPNRTVSPAWILEEYGTQEESWKATTIDRLDSRLVGSAITNDHNFMQVVHRFDASPLQYVPSLVLLDKQTSC